MIRGSRHDIAETCQLTADRCTWLYVRSEQNLYTVGFYSPDGEWNTDSDWNTPELAARRVSDLNGLEGTASKSLVEALERLREAESILGSPLTETPRFTQSGRLDWLRKTRKLLADNRITPENLPGPWRTRRGARCCWPQERL